MTRDGRHLYADYFSNGVARVYTLPLTDTVALARARLTRWWRPEECQQYLHVAKCPADQ